MTDKPKQIGALIDPNEPGINRYPYYLLEKMHSPPIAPEHAIRWEAFEEPLLYLRKDDPNDNRVAQGFIEYDRRLSWADLYKYNMLPMDYDESILFDLWVAFGQDKGLLLAYLASFFRLTKEDQSLRHLNLAVKMVGRELTLSKIRELLREVPDGDET